MSVARVSFAVALIFLVTELAIRWGIRATVEPGATVPILGKLYLTNATNVNSSRAFGLSSEAWLLVALAVCILIAAAFQYLLHNPVLLGSRCVALGHVSAFVLFAVVAANLTEAVLLGGVTDYLAIVDMAAGRATIVNLGDLVLFAALLTIVLSAIGVAVGVIVSDGKAMT